MEENKIELVLDIETSDPDDFLTLLFLAGHPKVHLVAVTCTPGTSRQMALIYSAIKYLGVHEQVRLGAFNFAHPKDCVSGWHYKAYGELLGLDIESNSIPASLMVESGPTVLIECCKETTTLMTGAPLKNLGAALKMAGPDFRLGRWVCQGGFAGVGVVPEELIMKKFAGKVYCPTFNLGGDIRSAEAAIASPQILKKQFVSKNVCHRVAYTSCIHQLFEKQLREIGILRASSAPQHEKQAMVYDAHTETPRERALYLTYHGMKSYIAHRGAKMLHDPLAAVCVLEPAVCTWANVDLARDKSNNWGALLNPESPLQISIDYSPELFWQAYLGIILHSSHHIGDFAEECENEDAVPLSSSE